MSRRGARSNWPRCGGHDPDGELHRRGIESAAVFDTLGHGQPSTEPIDGWLLDPTTRQVLGGRLAELATEHRRRHPLDAGLTVGAVARSLGLPEPRLAAALVSSPWRELAGRIVSTEQRPDALPDEIQTRIETIRERLRGNPFDALSPTELAQLGLTPAMLAAAVRAGLPVAVGDGVFLAPDAR